MIITVVGIGVIGGSYIQALNGLGHSVYGIDTDEKTLQQAKDDGCIVEGFVDGYDIIKESDMTIICLYPSLVLDFIASHEFKKGSIVTDVVGIKSYFLEKALKIIDKDVEYVSGHPMAGREKRVMLMQVKLFFKMPIILLLNIRKTKKKQLILCVNLFLNLALRV